MTLLEMLVATAIMAMVAVGVLSALSGAVRNAARLRDYDRVVQLAFERGLLVLGAGPNTIRLCPPLVVTVDQCEFALDTLEECLRTATANR